MTDAERINRIERYVRDELELSSEQVKRAEELKDNERKEIWIRRYDVFFGVLLRIID